MHTGSLKWYRTVWGLFMSLFLTMGAGGCANSLKEVKDMIDPPEEEVPLLMMAEPATAGSLWQEGNGRAFMFEDLRASRVGDIVTVKIEEQHSGSKTASTQADRESTYDGSFGGSLFGLGSFASPLVDGVEVNASTASEFDGTGSTSREDTLTGTIAARVIEVLQNGDLRIRGRREVTVNSERQTMVLSGIVRPVDVDTSNTVLSSAIANAIITYTGLGVVDDVQRPGWMVRILDWILPL